VIGAYEQMEDGSYRAAVPMPFWERGWRTWMRWRPMCCNTIFKTEEMYRDHYIRTHLYEGETQCQSE
jgi:hypothetical protein